MSNNTGYAAGYKLALNEDRWPSYAKRIAHPADPYEHSPGAVERLMKDLPEYVVDIGGERWQFRAKNRVEVISFATNAEFQDYTEAWAQYVERCSKINKEEPQGRFRLLAEYTMFRKKAEGIRSDYLADEMIKIERDGKAAVCACNFVQTILKSVIRLVTVHKVPREKISLIWGGDHTLNLQPISDEQFAKLALKIRAGEVLKNVEMKQIENYLLHKGESTKERQARLSIIEQAKNLNLGTQSKKTRQEEIDRFQRGDSLFCFYTFKAGGVGLSLHHSDDLTKQKVRRHEHNAYAYVEDIPSIPTRQRETILGPTFSAIETVQGLGRVPRVTSLSDTDQRMVFYKGTAEEDVAIILGIKLKCLSKVVAAKEGWEGAIYRRRDADAGKSIADGASIALVEDAMREANEKKSSGHGDDTADGDSDFASSMDVGLTESDEEEEE